MSKVGFLGFAPGFLTPSNGSSDNSESKSFLFDTSLSNPVIITHGFNGNVITQTTDSSGNEILINHKRINSNQISLTFASTLSGTIMVSKVKT